MADFIAVKAGAGDGDTPKGIVLATKGVYTVPATGPDDTETVSMVTIPAGATLLGLVLTADGGTASMTITVGDGTTATAFGTVTDATDAFEHLGTGMGVVTAADTEVILTVGTAAMTTADVYTCVVWYTMN